jgi:hydroxymethylpyrimidine pyrophosphatase-like HAD family hydrolase
MESANNFIKSFTFEGVKYDLKDELGQPMQFVIIPASCKDVYGRLINHLAFSNETNLYDRKGLLISQNRPKSIDWQSHYYYILESAKNNDVLIIELIDLYLDANKTKELIRAIKNLDKKPQVICTSYNSQVIELFYESERVIIH